MIKLDDLAIKYGTDKSTLDHGYTIFYEKHFHNFENVKNILELGIYSTAYDKNKDATIENTGASLKMWSEYFLNIENIYGIDIFDFNFLSNFNSKITTYICNAELRSANEYSKIEKYLEVKNLKFDILNGLETLPKNEYDIIIDDGPHTMNSQQLFLGYMFEYLNSNGIFVIEDLHTSYMYQNVYNAYPPTNITTLQMLKNFLNTGKIESDFILPSEKKYLENNIKEIIIEKANYSEIAFILKK